MAFLCVMLVSSPLQVNAQGGVLNSALKLEFVNKDGTTSADEVLSNVIKATNQSSRKLRFNIDLAYPSGWRPVIDLTKLYEVGPNETVFIPVRLIPSRNSNGDINYFISAIAYSEFGDALASTSWTVQIEKVSNWNLTVDKRDVYFTNQADSASIKLRLVNEGNSFEKVKLNFIAGVKLDVLDEDWRSIMDNSLYIELPAGIDTSLMINVRVREQKQKGYFFSDSPDDEQDKNGLKKYRLQINAHATDNPDNPKNRRVNFTKLVSQAKFDSDMGSSIIPLSVEINSYNILSNFTNFSIDLRGNADLGKQRFLNYSYQSIITSSSIAGTQIRGANRFLQYATPNYAVALGNVGENMGVFINGVGAKGSYRYKNFEVAAIYADNAMRGSRLSRNDLKFYGALVNYQFNKDKEIELQYVNQIDDFNMLDGNLYRMRANYKFAKSHRVGVIGAYSRQQDSYDPDSVFTTSGYGAELRYFGSIKNLNLGVNGAYYSKNFFARFGGTKQLSLNARYPLGRGRSIGFRGSHNTSQPIRRIRGNVFESPKSRSDLFQLRYEWRNRGITWTATPSYRYDELLGLRVSTAGLSAAFSRNNGRKLRVFSRFFAGLSESPDYDVEPYPVARWENRIRFKNLSLVGRYNYGPRTVTENLRVLEDQINPQSVFISAYASLYFRNRGFLFQPRINTRYESVFARWRTNMSAEFLHYAKSGYVFTAALDLISIRQGESPIALQNEQEGIEGVLEPFSQSNTFLRLGVKKDFKFKRPGSKAYEMKVIVFKDIDGNRRRDKGEELVENVIIKVNNKSTITDANGQCNFYNLTEGEYSIKPAILVDTQGWFMMGLPPINIARNETVYIPLTKGVQIKGSIVGQKATYSRSYKELDLSGIRISAIGDNEEVYSTVTDQEGKFSVFVPFGNYVVDVSSATIDEQFQFAQDSYSLNIDNAESNYELTFFLIEKKRKLNIKKFDNDKE